MTPGRVISPVRPVPKRRKPTWDFQESAIFGPIYNPAGDLCGVFVMRTPQGCTIVAVSFPADRCGHPLEHVPFPVNGVLPEPPCTSAGYTRPFETVARAVAVVERSS